MCTAFITCTIVDNTENLEMLKKATCKVITLERCDRNFSSANTILFASNSTKQVSDLKIATFISF